jgi:hypothetical protein
MVNAISPPAGLVRPIKPVISSRPGKREVEHDLAGALRPAVTLRGVFEPLQLATNIDEHAGKLRPGLNRAQGALLRGDDLIAPNQRRLTAPHVATGGTARAPTSSPSPSG